MKAIQLSAAFFLVLCIRNPVVGIQALTHEAKLTNEVTSWLQRVPHVPWLSDWAWLSEVFWQHWVGPHKWSWVGDTGDEAHQLNALRGWDHTIPLRREQMHFSRDSLTYFCVLVLTMQCMVIHTALSISRNTDELSGGTEPSLLTQTLTAAARGTVYPPMMCMLFVANRMYVLATSEGSGETQLWVKICMVAATIGMTLQFCLVLTLPMHTAHWEQKESEPGLRFEELAGEPSDVHVPMHSQRFIDEDDRATFEALQVLAFAFMYCGIIGVIVGIFTYPQGTTKVSLAILSTVFLTVLYFGVYFLLWLGGSNSINIDGEAYALRAAARQALLPIRKAPMLSVLFLASRMRALQLDPPHGMPSWMEQMSFIGICGALLAETVAALIIGATGQEHADEHGMPSYKASGGVHFVMNFFGFLVYCGMAPVMYGMLIAKAADGTDSGLSSTVSAVLQLAALYFIVHVLQWCVFMAQELSDTSFADAKAVVLAADVSVRLCPLICILFVACRLRALQLTHNQGSPQIWAQQAMYMSVFAMLVQMLSCLILPIAMGRAAAIDGDGCADWNMKPLFVAYMVTVMKYIALFCLHGGTLMVSIGIFAMTPDSAHMRGDAKDNLLERETLHYCFLVTVISLGFALFFSFAKVLGIIFKLAVEGFDKDLLGCEITVRMAAISLLRGWVNIADIVVNNPPFPTEGGSDKWSSPHLIKVKRVRADLDMVKLASSGGQVFEFEEILLQDVDVNYDKPWTLKDNVSCILEHLQSLKSQDVEQPPADEPEESPPGDDEVKPNDVKVVFRKVSIQNVTAQVYVSGPSGVTGQMNVALADLSFPDFEKLNNKELSNPEDPGDVQQELVLFIIRSLMETVAANIGPGKHIKDAAKVAADAMKKYCPCKA